MTIFRTVCAELSQDDILAIYNENPYNFINGIILKHNLNLLITASDSENILTITGDFNGIHTVYTLVAPSSQDIKDEKRKDNEYAIDINSIGDAFSHVEYRDDMKNSDNDTVSTDTESYEPNPTHSDKKCNQENGCNIVSCSKEDQSMWLSPNVKSLKKSSSIYVLRHKTKQTRLQTCSICGKNYKYEKSMLQHMKKHQGDFYSELCEGKSKVLEDLSIDFEQTQVPDKDVNALTVAIKPEEDDSNEGNFSTNVIKTEVLEHDLSCKSCPFIGRTKGGLKSHVRDTHNRKYVCLICHKSFGSTKDLKRHSSKHLKPIHKCRICDKLYKESKSLEKHLQQHDANERLHEESNKDNICNVSVDESTHNYDRLSQAEESHLSCKLCAHVAKTKAGLKSHMQYNHNKKFSCPICSKSFGSRKNVRRHSSTHSEATNKCEICGKMYKELKSLDKHIQRHKGTFVAQTVQCEYCSKSFCSKNYLQKHIACMHLGRPIETFLCQTCGKQFSQKQHYQRHMNIHSDIKPYVCEVCGMAFAQAKYLAVHNYIHSEARNFECPICHKRFKQREVLKIHKRIHTGIKNHLCSVCQQSFSVRGTLVRHQRIHLDLKPFACAICNNVFRDTSIVRRHLLLVHKCSLQSWKDHVLKLPQIQTHPSNSNANSNAIPHACS